MKLFNSPPTDLRRYHPKERQEITYSVSYIYNGGIVINNEWYDGYKVPPPIIPNAYAVIDIGVGLQLNCSPPYATGIMKPLSNVSSGQSYMDCDGVWKKKR